MAETAPGVPAQTLAQLLRLDARQLPPLERKGIVVKAGPGRYHLAASVSGYVAHLRDQLERSTPAVANAQVMAELLQIDDRSVRRLAQKGVIERAGRTGFLLKESVARYCAYLRKALGSEGSGEDVVDLTKERAKLAAVQRENIELKNAVLRREAIPADEVREGWQYITKVVRAAVLAIPGRVRAALPHLTATDGQAIDELCREALEDIAVTPPGTPPPEPARPKRKEVVSKVAKKRTRGAGSEDS